ncbi:hypothetical protein AAE478_000758 [Parahypoxylon ruwenzoriense]
MAIIQSSRHDMKKKGFLAKARYIMKLTSLCCFRPNSGDVSPIEEVPDMSQLAIESRGPAKPEPRTNIPMMRRERRKNSDAALNALRESKSRERLKQQRPYGHDVRWDPSTGEPTTDVKGRPSQVNPQEYAQGLGIREGSVSPPQTKRDQPDQNPFGERIRVRRPSGNPQPESSMGQRPEWRGASGRTTLVAPVNDTKNVPPLKLPRKSSKRAGREPNTLSPDSSAGSGFAPSLVAQSSGFEDNRGAPMQPTRLQSLNVAATDPNINNPQTYPSPPLSDNTAPTNSFAPSELPNQPHKSLQVPLNDRAIRRKPAGGTGHHPQQSTSSSIYSQQDVVQPKRAALTASLDGWTQPPSRFSVTTYATSQQSTPRGSLDEDRPPVPTPPQQFMQGNAISILDRKRPVVAGFEGGSRKGTPIEPVKISLDSPYYMTPAVSSKAPQAQQSSLSLATREKADTDKSLPPVPPETQSQDRVTQLDARLRVLGNRRINLNTAIRQMTELMPTDNILASEEVVRKRDEEKRKVEGLRRELADVERESYELGLKLHRAYKRLDRDAEFEPTTLWVRRVTG